MKWIEENTKLEVERFVTRFNETPAYKDFPIVSFQFVSLNNVHNGKMTWWNYLHKDASHKYNEAVHEFTGTNEAGEVKRTLINWEYHKKLYWYDSIGPSYNAVTCNEIKSSDFLDVSIHYDESGIENQLANDKEKNELLERWKDVLHKKFDAGSTMWVSNSHTEITGTNLVYSSVFCVFNKHVEETFHYDIVRLIKRFITDFTVSLHGFRLKQENALISLERSTKDYEFRRLHFEKRKITAGKSKIRKHVEALLAKYYNPSYIELFEKAYEQAFDRIKKTHVNGKFHQENLKAPLVYKPVTGISSGDSVSFFEFVYGRILILAYHAIFNLSLADSYHILKMETGRTSKVFVGEFQKMFCILGLKGDTDHNTEGKWAAEIDYSKIIPGLSDREFKFLIDCCDQYDLPALRKELFDERFKALKQ